MAANTGTDFEVRTTGSPTNGGGYYNLDPGTSVDYSQQDAYQLQLTDVAFSTTAISSVTGGFTDAMVGNCLYSDGGSGATAGFYQITAVTDTNNATIDKNGGTGTAATINIGGAWDSGSSLEDEFFEFAGVGGTIWVESGSYPISEVVALSASAGAANPTYVKGYTTARGDTCVTTDRPVFGLGLGDFTFAAYWRAENIIFDCTASGTQLKPGQHNRLRNIKVYDSGNTNTINAMVDTGSSNTFVECEFLAPSSYTATTILVNCTTDSVMFIGCHFHAVADTDAVLLNTTSYSAWAFNCVFQHAAEGFRGWSPDGRPQVVSCVFYDLNKGAHCYTVGSEFMNCIFHTCTEGIDGQTAGYATMTSHCMFYNNTTDINNGSLSDSDIEADPGFVDAPNLDFTIASGTSQALDAGIQLGVNVGLA